MHVATLQVGRLPIAVAFVLSLLRVSSAYADTVTLMWDPSVDPVTGYAVYVGSSQRVDVGNTTSYTLPNAVPGQQYCFAVAAYNSNGEGQRSAQLCGYSNQFPTLTNPGARTAKTGQATSLQLSGSDPEGQPITYTASGLPPGLFLGTATGYISGTPSTNGTYTVTASVNDGVLSSAPQNFTWTVTTGSTNDPTPPVVYIAAPVTEGGYIAKAASLALSGTASDNVGVTSVSWVNNRGGSGTATGTTNWSVPVVGLQGGSNVITITARDAAGNAGTDILTVTYNGTTADTTPPTVTITSPTTASVATSLSTIAISGTASDNVGVTAVSWSTDRGKSGMATGTTNWSAAVQLLSGANVVTITARDAAGNLGKAMRTVTYTVPDTTPPTITILGPTNAPTYSTTQSVVTLGGTASDNVGVTAVTWANNRGGSGFSSGTTSWSVPSVPLKDGTNVITVTAQDAAGNKATDTLTVTYVVPAPAPAPVPPPPPPSSITLSGRLYQSGKWVRAYLQWTRVEGRYVDIFLNGERVNRTNNDGSETENPRGSGPYSYRVCVTGTTVCSNTLILTR